jgi:hypothetical protein
MRSMIRGTIAVAMLLAVMSCGSSCSVSEQLNKAMTSVHDVIAPDYRSYVDADEALTAEQRAYEERMLERWDEAVESFDEDSERVIYTYIAPRYLAYLEADESRSQDQKDRRKRLVESWRRRLEEER